MSSVFLFESDFSVENKDLGGKKFDKVSRFQLESMNKDVVVVVDIATALYPLRVNDRVSLTICSTINVDGTLSDGTFDQTRRLSSEAQNAEYIMHGSWWRRGGNLCERCSLILCCACRFVPAAKACVELLCQCM
jgi:DNA-directed RNA polymerase I, II, and III subunit RPABC3